MSELSEIEKKILHQVEYYFSDVNLTKDKFLRGKITENDGWVELDVLLTFNRLKAMTNDATFLKETLAKAASDILEVKDTKVRRLVPFKLDENEDIFVKFAAETIYIKGFGGETSLETLEKWFENVVKIVPKSIHMRKFPRDKKFKGSIFATFSTHADAENFINSEEASKFEQNVLIRKWQNDYKKEKEEEWNARNEDKQKRQDLQAKAKRKEAEYKMTKGALLELSNLPAKEPRAGDKREVNEEEASADAPPKSTNMIIDFKAWLSEHLGEEMTKGMWLDLQPNENKAVVRLKAADSAAKAQSILEEKGLVYKEHTLVPRLVGGDEEIDYWARFFNAKSNKSSNRSHARNQGHGGHGNYANKRRRRD